MTVRLKLRLSSADKRRLALAALLVTVGGYYFLLFRPLVERLSDDRSTVQRLRQELAGSEAEVERIRSLYDAEQHFSAGSADLGENTAFEPARLAATVEAVWHAANLAEVEIDAIRPVPRRTVPGSSGAVVVEGTTTADGFVALISGLQGMELEEVELTKTSPATGVSLRYAVKFVVRPTEELGTTAIDVDKGTLGAFYFPDGAAAAEVGSGLARAAGTRQRASVAPPPALDFSGLRLVGVSNVGGLKMAMVVDQVEGRNLLLNEGDSVREFTLTRIGDSGITLALAGIQRELRLPDSGDEGNQLPRVGAVAPRVFPVPEVRRQSRRPIVARLRFSVTPITLALADERQLAVTRGLLVDRVDPGFVELRVDDIVRTANGIDVVSLAELEMLLRTVQSGEDVVLGVLRGERAFTRLVRAR